MHALGVVAVGSAAARAVLRIYPSEEAALIDAKMPEILPLLLPRAGGGEIETGRCFSPRRKRGLPVARVADGWCVFFNQGCVLHALGAAEVG